MSSGTVEPRTIDGACPLCGAAERWSLDHYRDPAVEKLRADASDIRPYSWYLCQICGNGYPSRQPDPHILAELWKQNRTDSDRASEARAKAWRHRQKISRKGAERSYRVFSPLHGGSPGRFLDIACGLGETVRFFADRGWDALGVDADPNVLCFHQNLGIRSEIGQIEGMQLPGKFDIVHISHAIYFIAKPRFFLESLRARLRNNGLLCIVLADFLASDDPALPNYHHTFFPTSGSMRYLLGLVGFQPILCQSISGSIYIAARAGTSAIKDISPRMIHLGFRSKRLRYHLLGRPKLRLRQVAKKLLNRVT